MTTTTTIPKPRCRPLGSGVFELRIGSRIARIWRSSNPSSHDWWYDTDEEPGRPCWGVAEALARCLFLCLDAPEPIEREREALALEIAKACGDASASAKLMRKLLRERTGRSWSVTCGRGTARCWLSITSPKARRVDSNNAPDPEGHAMSAEDRALLGLVLTPGVKCSNYVPHRQGESVRPGWAVRADYLWRIAGHPAPDDLVVPPPEWD